MIDVLQLADGLPSIFGVSAAWFIVVFSGAFLAWAGITCRNKCRKVCGGGGAQDEEEEKEVELT